MCFSVSVALWCRMSPQGGFSLTSCFVYRTGSETSPMRDTWVLAFPNPNLFIFFKFHLFFFKAQRQELQKKKNYPILQGLNAYKLQITMVGVSFFCFFFVNSRVGRPILFRKPQHEILIGCLGFTRLIREMIGSNQQERDKG